MKRSEDLLINSRFKLKNKLIETYHYHQPRLASYSRKERVLKEETEKAYRDAIKSLIAFNSNTQVRIKDKYMKDFIINIEYLDYLVNEAVIKGELNTRQALVMGKNLREMVKMAYGFTAKEECKSKS